MQNPLLEVVSAQKRGYGIGIFSACTANRFAIEATLLQVLADGTPALIEATSNQVNQMGGYTGMNPARFVDYVRGIATAMGFPIENILLGGDHLGPNPWQDEQATDAMAKAKMLIREYVSAGFTKIHLDTSMHLGGDPGATNKLLDMAIVAQRTAELCEVAEEAAAKRPGGIRAPLYIIGSDVPPPGGARSDQHDILTTPVQRVEQTINLAQEAFLKRNLESAWNRVIGVVVQPGVEFSHSSVTPYESKKARSLTQFIETNDQLVYEAHSTDYQTATSLRKMVEDHFAVLKVGPGLTFAFREAVFAFAHAEAEWLARKKGVRLSRIRECLEEVMTAYPEHWRRHYSGDSAELDYARKYSYSDRVRYYWSQVDVAEALNRLIGNLTTYPIPLTLLSQVLPIQYAAVREGRLANTPTDLIHHKVMEVTKTYSKAARLYELE